MLTLGVFGTSSQTVGLKTNLIDYALLAKDYYEEAYGHEMSDPEFLDREDDYVFTLFLDKNNKWSQTSIYIHSWRVVLHHDYEI